MATRRRASRRLADAKASPAALLLPDGPPPRSLGVIISVPWYKGVFPRAVGWVISTEIAVTTILLLGALALIAAVLFLPRGLARKAGRRRLREQSSADPDWWRDELPH